jgi:hypothetical protein
MSKAGINMRGIRDEISATLVAGLRCRSNVVGICCVISTPKGNLQQLILKKGLREVRPNPTRAGVSDYQVRLVGLALHAKPNAGSTDCWAYRSEMHEVDSENSAIYNQRDSHCQTKPSASSVAVSRADVPNVRSYENQRLLNPSPENHRGENSNAARNVQI